VLSFTSSATYDFSSPNFHHSGSYHGLPLKINKRLDPQINSNNLKIETFQGWKKSENLSLKKQTFTGLKSKNGQIEDFAQMNARMKLHTFIIIVGSVCNYRCNGKMKQWRCEYFMLSTHKLALLEEDDILN
jgi:hypothetical protein